MKRIRQLSILIEQRIVTVTHQPGVAPHAPAIHTETEGDVCPVCGLPSRAGAALNQQHDEVDKSLVIRTPGK